MSLVRQLAGDLNGLLETMARALKPLTDVDERREFSAFLLSWSSKVAARHAAEGSSGTAFLPHCFVCGIAYGAATSKEGSATPQFFEGLIKEAERVERGEKEQPQ